MKKIPLGNRLFALVDDEDYQRVKKYSWHTCKAGGRARNGEICVRAYNKTGMPKCYHPPNCQHRLNKKNGNKLYLHRVIMNVKKGELVDHINHNTLDNRKRNLRACTQQQNLRNRKLQPHSSRFKGVCWHKGAKKWIAYIGGVEKRKLFYLGLFTDEIEAGKAYNRAALKYFGEFGYLNPV